MEGLGIVVLNQVLERIGVWLVPLYIGMKTLINFSFVFSSNKHRCTRSSRLNRRKQFKSYR